MEYTQVSTFTPIRQLSDLTQEWGVLAFRPNGSGAWLWHLPPEDVRLLATMRSDALIVSAHRRDGDGTRLLAKLKERRK
jgi:hypothetical protein